MNCKYAARPRLIRVGIDGNCCDGIALQVQRYQDLNRELAADAFVPPAFEPLDNFAAETIPGAEFPPP